jgi:hypothetical protein
MVPNVVHLQGKQEWQLTLEAQIPLLHQRHVALVVEGDANGVRVSSRRAHQSRERTLQIWRRRQREALRKRKWLSDSRPKGIGGDVAVKSGVGELAAEVLKEPVRSL